MDGDGHDAVACGGDDCDDTDADRFPGNPETCDDGSSGQHDEDCDPATFGTTDRDGDGEVAAGCCNMGTSGPNCGTDCDDTTIRRRSGQVEFCDSTDNDDGRTDEQTQDVPWYLDSDGDGFGSATTPMISCTPRRRPQPGLHRLRRRHRAGAPRAARYLRPDGQQLQHHRGRAAHLRRRPAHRRRGRHAHHHRHGRRHHHRPDPRWRAERHHALGHRRDPSAFLARPWGRRVLRGASGGPQPQRASVRRGRQRDPARCRPEPRRDPPG
ncbi:MAG: hypothetical protein IPI43_28195 [Sandaracinaceae bacterium]|nr:hypothetical protein [Sandaracinaceae bacterium]